MKECVFAYSWIHLSQDVYNFLLCVWVCRTGWFADGMGQDARFRCPMGAVQADDGNLYVTDWGNHCIRKRTPCGMWSTVAGKPGEKGFQDGPGEVARFNNVARITIDWETGDLIVTDRDNHCIRRVILIQVCVNVRWWLNWMCIRGCVWCCVCLFRWSSDMVVLDVCERLCLVLCVPVWLVV